MKNETWHEWVEEYLAWQATGPGENGPSEERPDKGAGRARETLGAWLAEGFGVVAGEEPDREKLRESVEQMLYRSALSGAGSAELDRGLEVLKAFSAWCCATGKLSFDFARDIPWTGQTDPELAAHMRSQWGLNDRFYGIGENE